MTGEVLGVVNKVLMGKAEPFTRRETFSGIDKHEVSGRVMLESMGFIGDEQGDLRVHGGIEKAVHLYPYEHYALWREELGALDLLRAPGAFGENLSTTGVNEDTICIGDRVRIGETVLEVSQGRQPCWKLNDRFDVPDMAMRLQNTLRTGWYFRVLEAGTIGSGDEIILENRPWPEWPMSRVAALFYQGVLDPKLLNEALTLPLVSSWRKVINKRLTLNCIEDWSPRMDGPAF